jgi:hypothetical protein
MVASQGKRLAHKSAASGSGKQTLSPDSLPGSVQMSASPAPGWLNF